MIFVMAVSTITSNARDFMMRMQLIAAIGVVSLSMLGGCDKAKSPDAVANDVSSAQQGAAAGVADARNDASKDIAAASAKVDDKSKDLNNVEAKGAYDVGMATADGNHKVTIEKCNAMSGDSQKKCKDLADADYEAAKANLKAAEVSSKQ
jgi:hypothetical protein